MLAAAVETLEFKDAPVKILTAAAVHGVFVCRCQLMVRQSAVTDSIDMQTFASSPERPHRGPRGHCRWTAPGRG